MLIFERFPGVFSGILFFSLEFNMVYNLHINMRKISKYVRFDVGCIMG